MRNGSAFSWLLPQFTEMSYILKSPNSFLSFFIKGENP